MEPTPVRYKFYDLLKRLLNSLVWGVVLALNAAQLSVSLGAWGAFIGGVGGFWLGYKVAASRLRLPVVLVGGFLLNRILSWLAHIPTQSTLVAQLLGPETASAFTQGAGWLVDSLCLVAIVHAISIRYAWFIACELIIVANVGLWPLAAHRDGYISRPYFFVDALWSRGWDPVPFFVGAGVLLAGALILLIVSRSNKRSSYADLLILFLLISLVGIFLPLKDLRQPLPEQIIGGEAQSQEQEESKSKSGGGGSYPQEEDPNSQNEEESSQSSEDGQSSQGDQSEDSEQKQDRSQDEEDQSQEDQSTPPPPQPMAVVIFNDDYVPPEGYFYFRQNAKSFFNGLRLVNDVSGSYDHDVASQFPQPQGANPLTPPQLNPEITKPVETKVSLIADHPKPFALITPLRLLAAPNPNPSQFIGAYRVFSRSYSGKLEDLLTAQLNNPRWSKEDFTYYTQLPDDPRYAELAQKIEVEMVPEKFRTLPMAKVLGLKLWLDKNTTYDTRVRVRDKEDVVAKFLFGERVGYCVHLSNALAYLCRASGIPARVAEGYAVDYKNTYGGSSLLIMDNNGHSWCEVYVRGLGWYPIDVSPERSNVEPAQPPDPDLQKMLGEMAREEATTQEGTPEKPVDMQLQMRRLMAFLGWFLAILLVLALVGAALRKLQLHLWAHLGQERERAERVYGAALVSLAEVGVRRRYGETREEFAQRLGDKVPTFEELTKNQVRLTLGSSQNPPFDSYIIPAPSTEESARLYAQFKGQLVQLAPWWRRWLGILNPVAWLFVR